MPLCMVFIVWCVCKVEKQSLLHQIVQFFTALHLETPSIDELVDLIDGQLINVRSSCLLQGFPNPELVIKALDFDRVRLSIS